MKFKVALFLLFMMLLSSCRSLLFIEPNEKNIEKIVSSLDKELNDTIKSLNRRCDVIREDMLEIIEEKKFDEIFIFGENRKYFNEGMSQYFISVPKPMVNRYMDRDKKVEHLENLHVALFHLDVKILLAKQSKHFLDSIAANNKYSTIYEDDKKISKRSLKKIIAFKALKFATEKVDYSIKGGSDRIEIKFISNCEKTYEEDDLLPEYIEGSFPYDGQYNFYLDESRKNVSFGFIKLAGNIGTDLYSSLVMVFTDTRKKYQVVDAVYDGWYGIIYFKLPYGFLKKNNIYKMQLAVVKNPHEKKFKIKNQMKRYVYNVFNILKTENVKYALSDFTFKHNPIYFRTSKYDNVAEKFDIKQPLSVDNPFKINLQLDEPLDSIEMYGNNCTDKSIDFNPDYINFKLHITNKFSKRLAYYLTVPQIETIDTLDINKNYTALIDNTYKSHDIIFANGKLAGNYIEDINQFFGINFGFNTSDYCQQDVIVKRISEKDFLRKKVPEYKNVHLVITYPDYLKIADSYDQLIKKVLTRKKERANYYYNLYVIENKRNNKKNVHDLQFFLDREEKIVKSILKSNYKEFSPYDLIKPGDKIRISYKVPYTDMHKYNIPIKIKIR